MTIEAERITARTERVADGAYAVVAPEGGWCVSNAGLVVGEDLVVLIDSAATQGRAEALRAEVGRVTDRPVDVLVTTHFHGDHHFGHHLFSPPALVVSHPAAREDLLGAGHAMQDLWPTVEWGEVPLRPPLLTVTDRSVLHAGDGLRIELRHLGVGHTRGDLVAWLPEQRVLFCGDLAMSGVTPFCLMGSVDGSLAALDELALWEPAVVVSGHGPVGGPEVLEATADYLWHVRELAARAGGRSALEIAEAEGPGPFADLVDPERLVPNLHRALVEARASSSGEDPRAAVLDVPAAYADMITYLGGPPVSHA